MATTKRKGSNAGKEAADTGLSEPAQEDSERNRHIATAAYYKAQARGFAPGREVDDWLEAEAEIAAGGMS
ncbi:MAG: DUF2934 domain-containing protein [Rhodocyclaceae bacterium]|nr:DUF2934 domain-containing protein [Rhodocyclaceae bacterium]